MDLLNIILKNAKDIKNLKKQICCINKELILPMPAQVNSIATDVAGIVADFNSLLTKLRTAGLLEV